MYFSMKFVSCNAPPVTLEMAAICQLNIPAVEGGAKGPQICARRGRVRPVWDSPRLLRLKGTRPQLFALEFIQLFLFVPHRLRNQLRERWIGKLPSIVTLMEQYTWRNSKYRRISLSFLLHFKFIFVWESFQFSFPEKPLIISLCILTWTFINALLQMFWVF